LLKMALNSIKPNQNQSFILFSFSISMITVDSLGTSVTDSYLYVERFSLTLLRFLFQH
jgi:hypothetical protein